MYSDFKISRKHNKELFLQATFKYVRTNVNSEGELIDRVKLTSAMGPFTQSGQLEVQKTEQEIKEICATVASKTTAGFSKFDSSFEASFMNRTSTAKGSVYTAVIPYDIKLGRTADVQGCLEFYKMQARLENVHVTFPPNSRLVYCSKGHWFKQSMPLPSEGIQVSGTYNWVYIRMRALVMTEEK